MLVYSVCAQRPRYAGQYVSQQEWEMEGKTEDIFFLGRRYNVLDKFHSTKYQTDYGFVKEMHGVGEWFVQCMTYDLNYKCTIL